MLRYAVENCDATELVEHWLKDDASKLAYRKELVFMQLQKLLRSDDLAPVNWVNWVN